MRFLNSLQEKEVRILILILYSVGVTGIFIPFTRELFILLTPPVLILSFILLWLFHKPGYSVSTIILFSVIFLASFGAEVAGVQTGVIFGHYSYGRGLGPKLAGTPLMIGINWVLLVYCSHVIIDRIPAGKVMKITGASALMVIYDIVMEQVAPSMDMWTFTGGNPPLRNYIAWFILAFLFHALLHISGIKVVNKLAPVIFWSQLLFFIILFFFFKII
ncbi:MAG: carotenoid biosynthesis protein [Bacteroidales bacterium]|nr:carotenoid biosynthesis protein [Bacteroidales bacterium]